MKTAIIRKAHFNAAHRLHRKDWSDKKNNEVFGSCNNPHYHGHNYEMEIKVIGEVDPETGYVMDLGKLKQVIKAEVEDRYDHKNLNEQLPEFEDLNPTAENIAQQIYKRIKAKLNSTLELQVTLHETQRNSVVYPVK